METLLGRVPKHLARRFTLDSGIRLSTSTSLVMVISQDHTPIPITSGTRMRRHGSSKPPMQEPKTAKATTDENSTREQYEMEHPEVRTI